MKIGDAIPEITLKTDKNEDYPLRSLAGGPAVIYFYPRADTPGCTKEACDFNERVGQFRDIEGVIVGISPDNPAKLQKFRDKHGLDLILLSDPDNEAAKAFGVWREKKMYGKTYMGIVRSTFVFDDTGKLSDMYDKVRVKGHAEKVLESFLN